MCLPVLGRVSKKTRSERGTRLTSDGGRDEGGNSSDGESHCVCMTSARGEGEKRREEMNVDEMTRENESAMNM